MRAFITATADNIADIVIVVPNITVIVVTITAQTIITLPTLNVSMARSRRQISNNRCAAMLRRKSASPQVVGWLGLGLGDQSSAAEARDHLLPKLQRT